MSFSDRLNESLDELYSGLKGDLELLLDVKAELKTHIEESIAIYMEEDGLSESEAQEATLKDFGSFSEIANDLVDANKKRMKRKARVRLFIKAALIPLALISVSYIAIKKYGTTGILVGF